MSKIRFVAVLWIGVMVASLEAHAQNLDKILETHFAAIGQENLLAMRSIFMKVREMDGFTAGKTYEVTKKVPNKIRIAGMWQEQTYVKAFDGQEAWKTAPWTGELTPQPMTKEEKNTLLVNVGIGSPLYDYGLGNTLALIGSERADDSNHYVIRSTMPSGYYVDYLIDKKDHLIHLARIYDQDQNDQVERQVIFKNYKDLGGVSIPFGFEHRLEDRVYDVVIDDIIFGQGAPNSVFQKSE